MYMLWGRCTATSIVLPTEIPGQFGYLKEIHTYIHIVSTCYGVSGSNL